MKKYLITTTLLLLSIVIQASSPVIIQGKWDRNGKDVSLFQIVSGRLEILSTYNLQSDRSFGFSFSPEEEGYYVIGSGNTGAKTDKYIFYFKPGDKLNVEVTDDSYKLIGDNTPENQVLQEWHNKMLPLEAMSVYFFKNRSTYVDFFPLLDEFVENNNTESNTGNSAFDNSFKKMSELDLLSTALHFIFTPRSAHPHIDDYPDYYRQVKIPDITKDNSLLEHPFGASILRQLLTTKVIFESKDGQPSLNEVLSLLGDNSIKGEYILSQAAGLKSYIGYKDLMEPNKQFLVTDDQIDRAKAIETKLATEKKEGEAAIDFTYKDVNGKSTSLSDFKGKVVLVDVWATWCGPCTAQLPHLISMAKEYEGKDVVFMGVSVDDEKDYNKWKEFVNTKNTPGVQLFAGGFGSDIAKFYGITAIPRFMLFDKAGNIVSKNAPRPSEKELKLLIDNELKK